MKHEMQAVFIH